MTSPAPKVRILVIPPLAVIGDPMKMAVLSLSLRHEFPELTIVLADENTLPGNQSAVALYEGSEVPEDRTFTLMDEVREAMHALINRSRVLH